MKSKKIFLSLFVLVTALLLAFFATGCASKTSVYPTLDPDSKFERKVTTVWGQTEVIYTRGPASASPAK